MTRVLATGGETTNVICYGRMQEQTLNEILEIVGFLKDNMAMKEELEFVRENMVTKGEFESKLTEVKTEIMTHVDSFIVLHQKLDTELVALRAKYERLEGHIQQLAQHLHVELHS